MPTSEEEVLEEPVPKKATTRRVLKRPASTVGHTFEDVDAAFNQDALAKAFKRQSSMDSHSTDGSSAHHPLPELDDTIVCHPEKPRTSGVFDFIDWVMTWRLPKPELGKFLQKVAATVFRTGSMCAGMGTEEIVLHGLKLALARQGIELSHKSVFKAEMCPSKLVFLKSTYNLKETLFFRDNRDLQNDVVKDADGDVVSGRLEVDALFCGIVCKDISPLSTTPKPERAEEGKSGGSLDGLLKYIRALPLQSRPKFLILECVERLSHKRCVDPDGREGTKYIADELGSLGYCGEWLKVNSKDWFLPQSRPRVYGLFLRGLDLSPKSRKRRVGDVEAAVKLIEQFKALGSPEELEAVLHRSRNISETASEHKETEDTLSAAETWVPTWEMGEALEPTPKWRREHYQYAQRMGITKADMEDFPKFLDATKNTLAPRAVEGLWLHLVHLKKTKGHDWSKGFCIASVGASINFMSVRSDIFPCVTPKMNFCALHNGQTLSLRGLDMLALQGVQNREVAAFKLNAQKGSFLQELAGNAFTSNIFAAFLIAGLAVA
jgi:site-specific DNA-cytosine methylase